VQDAEHARQHLARRPPLQNREAGDVADDVREADQAERDERCAGPGKPAQEKQRPTRTGHRDAERRGQPPMPHERQRECRADQPADPHGGVEVADAARAEIEQLESRYGDEDAEGAVHERLRSEEADDQPQARVASDCAEAGARLLEQMGPLVSQRRLRHAQQRREHERRPEKRGGGYDEDDPDVRDGDQYPAERGADAEAEALERAGAHVRGRQFFRSAGK
jgi:hypothetical protein